jgi:hypothetical protein
MYRVAFEIGLASHYDFLKNVTKTLPVLADAIMFHSYWYFNCVVLFKFK